MLIRKRRLGEGIEIRCPDGTRIRIVVKDLWKESVSLGIRAPSQVVIHRDEVWDEIDAGRERPPSE